MLDDLSAFIDFSLPFKVVLALGVIGDLSEACLTAFGLILDPILSVVTSASLSSLLPHDSESLEPSLFEDAS